MADCIFCAIVAGELPATVIAADERAIAFMDINPAPRGHALVIPRAHSLDIHDIGAEDLAAGRRLIAAGAVLDERQRRFSAKVQKLCAAQRGIPCGMDDRVWRFQKADAQGALDLYVIAEGTGEMDGAQRAHIGIEAFEQQPETPGDGPLG